MKKRSGSVTPAGLIALMLCFEETRSLQDWSRESVYRIGAPRLAEVRTSSKVSQMNNLREQSMNGLPVPVCSRQEVARNTDKQKTSAFLILHGVLQLYLYKLQSLQQLLPDDAAKPMSFANWALSEFEENPQ